MEKITLSETRKLIDNINNGDNTGKVVALFPHRDGTNATLKDLLNASHGQELRGPKFNADPDAVFYYASFYTIGTKKETFILRNIDPLMDAAKGKQVVLLFRDWRANRDNEMWPELEKAKNWLEEEPEKFTVYSVEAHSFSDGKAID